MANQPKDLYFVAVKLLLRDGDKLLITHDIFGDWDLPGGRLLKSEFDTPLLDVITRKIREELGSEIKYRVGEPNIFFRHERIENGTSKVHIFAVGYNASYESGEIKLSENHDRVKWVDIATFQPEKYFTGGWLTGVQEYLTKSKTELS